MTLITVPYNFITRCVYVTDKNVLYYNDMSIDIVHGGYCYAYFGLY